MVAVDPSFRIHAISTCDEPYVEQESWELPVSLLNIKFDGSCWRNCGICRFAVTISRPVDPWVTDLELKIPVNINIQKVQ